MHASNVNSRLTTEDYLLKATKNLKENDFINNTSVNSTNLESIIKNCRLLLMTDNFKNKPRKIILDTRRDNCKNTPPRNKEAQRLSEIVFGNFCLSSKADGYKLHTIKNPAEVILSKLFNVPFNSVFYDNRIIYQKVSPDSGNNQSLSPYSSNNSISSSNPSWASSSCINPQSPNSNDSSNSHMSLSRSTSRNRALLGGQRSSTPSLSKDGSKNSNNGFFNDNFDVYNYRNNVMMSAIFMFSLPEENKAEFEEFIFQYYAMLESILNRIACLILEDCYNIYNGKVVDCWKRSKRWIISLLPRPSVTLSATCISKGKTPSVEECDKRLIDVQMFKEVVNYFAAEKRLSFLAQIISAVLTANPNASSKYLRGQLRSTESSFPYAHILQNLGIDLRSQTFNRIIVKGLMNCRRTSSSSSWKDRFSSSLNFYKKMWNLPTDNSISCSDIDISMRGIQCFPEPLTETVSDNNTSDCKEVQMVTALIANLIRPMTKVVYQQHIIPSDVPTISHCKKVTVNGEWVAIEVPLLDDGLMLDQEVLPENHELFSPTIIANQIAASMTPLQGFVYDRSTKNLESQLVTESKQSRIMHRDKLYQPDFLVVDVDSSSVMRQSHSIQSSCWVQKLINDFSVLLKVDGYDHDVGQLFLESSFADLSQKVMCINQHCSEIQSMDLSYLMELHGLAESDLSLLAHSGTV